MLPVLWLNPQLTSVMKTANYSVQKHPCAPTILYPVMKVVTVYA